MTVVASSSDEAVLRALSSHPNVLVAQRPAAKDALEFEQDGWNRRLVVGDASCDVAGLVETMDNNPMVCADVVSLPGPAATLALIALEPLIRAGLLIEPPAIQIAGCGEEDVEAFLHKSGWPDGAAVSFGDESLGQVVAANIMALVPAEIDPMDVLGLYRECFGRSLFVREHQEGDWDASHVIAKPFACYRVTMQTADPVGTTRLITVQVMADRDGKGGATQIVHALNVMCGFAESAGILG